jgi:hypothetical protein
MKLQNSVFNKTHVMPAFLPQAIKIAEFFDCAVQIKCDTPMPGLLEDMDFLPVKTGRITVMEVCIQGDEAKEALSAIRRCMSECFCESNFQAN